MKKILILILSLTLVLTSCSKVDTLKNEDEKKPQIFASIYPVYEFVSKIGGDKIDLTLLVESNIDPHSYEPTPKDILKMQEADVVFYNGLEMESWIQKTKETLKNSKTMFVELAKTVVPISFKNDEHTEHNHINDEHTEHNHINDEHTEHNHTNDEHNLDPHIWLDPNNVLKEIELIKDILIQTDPKNKDYYLENFNNLKTDLEKLDASYKKDFSHIKNNKIVVTHEAYGYLCNAYGLEQIPISSMSSDEEPTPLSLANVIDFIKNNNIKYIFHDKNTNFKIADTIIKETDVQILNLSTFEVNDTSSGSYIEAMQKNLENLKKALLN